VEPTAFQPFVRRAGRSIHGAPRRRSRIASAPFEPLARALAGELEARGYP
jgi:hypothetical protein